MKIQEAVIKNKNGIHCRPSAVIIAATRNYPGEIRLKNEVEEVELDSIISLLSLGLAVGTRVQIRVDGPEENEVADRMVRLLEYPFDFPPKTEEVEFDPQELARKLAVWPLVSEAEAVVQQGG